jgi:hypothetical protein
MASDYEEGRVATPGDLVRDLPHAGIGYLDGALANPGLEEIHLVLLLHNPVVSSDLILRLSRSPIWMRSDRVRAAMVLHQRTPVALAMGLLSQLRWRELALVAETPRLGVALRKSAEKVLLLRIAELALGEKITLARAATAPVLGALKGEDSALVIRALLDNPRLRVEDALDIAGRPDVPGSVLQVIAESSRFAANEEVRIAVAIHPSTPPAVALRVVHAMELSALRKLLDLADVPPLVRLAASRRLGEPAVDADPIPT